MTDPFELARELASPLLLLGALVWGIWDARRRLRPFHLWLAVAGAAVSVPVTVVLLVAALDGQFSGWGGLGLVVVLLPAALVAALSVTALLMFAVLLPRHGFDPRTPEQRRADRAQRNTPEARRARALFELKVSAVALVVVLLLLAFRRFRP